MLTYTPDNAIGWQVEAGNVGHHYFEWRYHVLNKPLVLAPSPPSGYASNPSYTSDCGSRPAGTICLGFSDGYTWLTNAQSIESVTSAGTWDGHPIEVATGVSSQDGLRKTYSHILNTLYIKEQNAP